MRGTQVVGTIAAMLFSIVASSGEPPPPEKAAPAAATRPEPDTTTCVACHGPDGISPGGIWPNLAGQKAPYLEKQLKAFRAGTRADLSMAAVAATLTDEDIRALANYYSSLPAGIMSIR